MSFQHQIFLYALPLALLPIIIHLFASRMQRKTPFPWVKLLIGAQYEGRRRRKLLEILILILRTLAIGSLVLLAASPYRGELFKFKYVAVDNSPSMRHDSVKISSLIKEARLKNPSLEIFYILDKPYESPLDYDIPADLNVLKDIKGPGIVISDFQVSNTGTYKDPSTLAVKIPPPDDIVKILAVRAEPGITMRSFEAHLKVFLKANERKAVRLNLYSNEKLVTGGNFEVSPDSVNVLTLRFIPTHGGIWKVEILPFDDLPEDNIQYFPITVLEKLSIGIVGNNRFIAKGLNPFKIKNYPLKVKNGLRGSEDLTGFDVLFLTDMTIPYPTLMNVLRYTENGGRLIIFSNKIPPTILNVLGISGRQVDSSIVILEQDTLKFKKVMSFEDGNVILQDVYDRNIVISRKFAAGECILVGLPSDVNESLFPISPSFVPFLYSLVEKVFNTKDCNVVVNAGTPCMEVMSGKEVVKTPWGQNVPCSLLKFQKIGLYRDSLDVGVNLPKVESESRFLSRKELRKRFANVYDYEGFKKLVGSSRSYAKIFEYFLLFYLIFESALLGWKFRQ